jgi:hypothetical protein
MDPRNASRRPSARAERVTFSLRDTPLTLAAKEAARANISLEEYSRFTDDDSPTKALLLATDGQATVEDARAIADAVNASPDERMLLLEGAEGVPTDPAKRELALRLARGEAASVADAGTFASEARAALTAEESAVAALGVTIDDLKTEAAKWQGIVDE